MSKYAHNIIDLSVDNTHTKVIKLAGKNKTVLDIGCSSGYLDEVLVKEFGCTVTGLEIDRSDAKKAAEICEQVIISNVDAPGWEKELKRKKFDVIILADVLEHLVDPASTLERLGKLLNDTGYFVISIPNIAHFSVRLELLLGGFMPEKTGILDSTHLKYFTLDTFIDLLHSIGLKVNEFDYMPVDIPEKTISELLKKLNLPVSEELRTEAGSIRSVANQFIFKASFDGKEVDIKKLDTIKPKLHAEQTIFDLENEMKKRDKLNEREIKQREGVIKKRDEEIEFLRNELKKRAKEVEAEMERRAEITEREIKKRDEEISKRGKEIDQLVKQVRKYKRHPIIGPLIRLTFKKEKKK